MRKRLLLLVWIAGIIFPMAGLGRISPQFRHAFNAVFGPNWMHVVMHSVLFAVLVLLVLAATEWKPGWRAAGVALLAILVVAVVQEGLQALSQGVFPLAGAVYDLGVDLCGGAVGYGVFLILGNKSK
jgi:chloramphenicol 3-O-phosphotransferase